MKQIYISRKFVAAGTLVICIIALLFSAISIYAAIKMQSAAVRIYEHPYTVSNAAREMRSRLLDMKQFISVFLTDGFKSVEETDALLKARYALQQESIDLIKERYLGPPEDVSRLQAAMNALIAAQNDALAYVPSHSNDEIQDYVVRNLFPMYDAVGEVLSNIIDFAGKKVQALERESANTAKITIVIAVLLSCIIIGFAVRTHQLSEQRRKRDVADREKLFDILSTNVDDVFFIYHLKNREMEYVSPNCKRILGMDEGRLTESRALHSMLDKEDIEAFTQLFGGGVIHSQVDRDFKLIRRDRSEPQWMNLRVYPVAVGETVIRYIISMSDQTERILVQQNLRDALAVAQNANDAKKDFLSRMSHEIRTPLNAIIGMTAIATANIQDPDRIEDCLAKIGFSSKHLLTLINDVLDMSKIEEGKLVVSKQPFEFRQLMESITSIIYSQANARKQNFEAAIVDFTEESLVGDSLRVNQILLNLLSNAVKFTPEGGSIRLEIRQLSRRNGRVHLRFTVSDTGAGMSKEFLKRLYLPFEQADNDNRRYGGTGLGMSITKNLVSLLGGTIQVSSTVGKGTTFIVELPFELTEQAPPMPKTQELSSLRVLVVDDDQDTCVHTSLLLEKLQIDANWVLTGAEAVRLVVEAHQENSDYDVCLIDWQMPGMDGVETTHKIREHVGPDTLIIIISAYDWSPIEKAAREAGANAFISKPVFASTIYNALLSATYRNWSEPAEDKELPGGFGLEGKRVLLAEDNDLNMEIATEILRMAGMEVECARNGQEAVDMATRADPGYYDLVLMDIQMPVMNGHEATRKIRASGSPRTDTLPIIAMTANAFEEDIAAALEAGMNGHIAKPIDTELLYETLSRIVKKADE